MVACGGVADSSRVAAASGAASADGQGAGRALVKEPDLGLSSDIFFEVLWLRWCLQVVCRDLCLGSEDRKGKLNETRTMGEQHEMK